MTALELLAAAILLLDHIKMVPIGNGPKVGLFIFLGVGLLYRLNYYGKD